MIKNIFILLMGLVAAQVTAGTTDNIFKIYGVAANRTVLRGSLPELPTTIISQIPKDKTNAVFFIEAQLKANQLDVVYDGTKFVMILPAGWQKSPLAKELNHLGMPPKDDAIPPKIPADLIPPGTISLQGVRLNQFLKIYSSLRGRTVTQPSPLPNVQIQLQTQTPLTKHECIHAFDVILLLNGIAAIDDGDKFVKMVPIGTATRTQ